jgi:hypothetical protein
VADTAGLPPSVEVVEVAPRDGLQNEDVPLSTEDKVELVERAVAAGARRVEVTSFVNPRRVPQMADADEVMAGVRDIAGLRARARAERPWLRARRRRRRGRGELRGRRHGHVQRPEPGDDHRGVAGDLGGGRW